ncbi:DUF927 domain-containing protein [Mycobacterium sp. KBS0706]|uniref:DUF927 domain-containing protein n=1 Tax=Mycobacterium sp. KBS0706 TaxID=2578109 RepID=UPI00110F7B11|nr:DUF927 domain-containing protein [Mycobacterium sp. KBS0706]TSD90293.1 DUF927 domain-containing protein [Mycobacterium sp. KBS0706]
MTPDEIRALAVERYGYPFTPTDAGLLLFKDGRIAVDIFGPSKGLVRDTATGEEWSLVDPAPAPPAAAEPVVEVPPAAEPAPPTPLEGQDDGATSTSRARQRGRPTKAKTATKMRSKAKANGADPEPVAKALCEPDPMPEAKAEPADDGADPDQDENGEAEPVEESVEIDEPDFVQAPSPDPDSAVVERNGFRLVRRQVKGFRPGLYRAVEIKAKGGEGETVTELKWIWFASLLEVLALARTAASEGWSVVLRLADPDGVEKRIAMPMGDLDADNSAWRQRLRNAGLQLAPGREAKTALEAYLLTWGSTQRALSVAVSGWRGETAMMFVTPDRTIGPAVEPVIFVGGAGPSKMNVAGTVEDWRDRVAALCVGNPYLVFFTAVSFAAPLPYFSGEPGGGFHLVGSSSVGKTTALIVAGSPWGGGGRHPERGFTETWRVTDNGLEGIAQRHNDLPLILDEIGEARAEQISNIVYMVANGQGKGRAQQDGTARERGGWRTLLLSSGEKTLQTLVGEIHRMPKAGLDIRLLNIPIPDGRPLGLLDDLHGFTTPEEFVHALRDRATRCYGAAGIAYLERLIEIGADALKDRIAADARAFIARHDLGDAHGQVKRAATRFALVETAGTLATEVGITGWHESEAPQAADVAFHLWLGQRAGVGDAEIERAIEQVRLYIQKYGISRFQPVGVEHGDDPRIVQRAGFRKMQSDGSWEYLVLTEVWEREVCPGFDAPTVVRALAARGLAVLGKDRPSNSWWIKDKTQRGYHLLPAILTGGPEEDEEE